VIRSYSRIAYRSVIPASQSTSSCSSSVSA
jgi:hypothetical protein